MNESKAIEIKLDEVSFVLRNPHDFSWLTRMGRVFRVFDQNDSGNLSFGVDTGTGKLFVKAAGLETMESVCTPTQAIENLRRAMQVYEDVRHPALIRLREHYPIDGLYVSVFDWVEGDCLFDHWNFDHYEAHPEITPPGRRFKELPIQKRLAACRELFSFLEETARSGYVAVDFYDGSILYDFAADRLTICDIDLFVKAPAVNKLGEDHPGTKRLKAPEEYILGAPLDERTNVFTLGALLLTFFPDVAVAPQRVLHRAASPERRDRYASIKDFADAWEQSLL